MLLPRGENRPVLHRQNGTPDYHADSDVYDRESIGFVDVSDAGDVPLDQLREPPPTLVGFDSNG